MQSVKLTNVDILAAHNALLEKAQSLQESNPKYAAECEQRANVFSDLYWAVGNAEDIELTLIDLPAESIGKRGSHRVLR
jgi:hypothetical protein